MAIVSVGVASIVMMVVARSIVITVFIVGVVTVYNMRWYIVMHNARKRLDPNDTTQKAANICILSSIGGQATLIQVVPGGWKHTKQGREKLCHISIMKHSERDTVFSCTYHDAEAQA